ncbi:MAG TPA: ankyrin repeat domain-containing protein [Pseudonocardia sp.]|nr:ankyrin repeat domain-containing protein [Pseudonocardia sp.]
MPSTDLPDDPDLGQLRKQARELQRAVRAGNPEALALAAEFHPGPVTPQGWLLSAAQLVVARRHRFPSWPALTRYLGVIAEYRTAPDEATPSTDPGTEFLRRACLTYSSADGPLQRSAAEVIAEHPDLGSDDIWVAAARADADSVGRLLRRDAGLAARPGGPHRWPPIAYLAYARHDTNLGRDAVVGTARLLLGHGANPDTGFLWHGLPTPFTLLTGVFGYGEQGPEAQPRHPQEHALARLLLEAGADPNDAQGLYNRMFTPADDHLELLFEFGLGTGDGGPWRRRLGGRAPSPEQLLHGQLAWAATHGFTHRVALLADHRVDLTTRLDGYGVRRQTAYEAARTSGQFEVVRLLEARGVGGMPLSPEDEVIAAVLAGDRGAVGQLGADALATARARRPGLVVWAAVRDNAASVRLAAELGWDVSAKARADAPGNDEWETALHHAAGEGNVELARLLLDLGADPYVHDHRFDGTPLDWARHFDQPATTALLERLTEPR